MLARKRAKCAVIPNAPRIPGSFTGGNGAGMCIGTEQTYPTSGSDFTREVDGLQDHYGDSAWDSSSSFTYSINLSQCFIGTNNFTHIDVSWAAGEEILLPVQMTNKYGDTAAQNICLIRDNS